LTALFFFAPWLTFGQDVHSSYQTPTDLTHVWAQRASVFLAVATAALILYNLIRRPHRMSEPATRWMLFLGICLLPLPVLFMSGAVGMEQSKNIQFCGSCHVMEPFVENMQDPDSDLLAALHYKNRYIQRDHCYRCHTDYGFLGNIEAKKDGVDHVWRNITSTYTLPIRKRKPFHYTVCLDCHGQAKKFLEESFHEGVIDEVLRGETGCLDCHVASHPGHEVKEAPPEDESENGAAPEGEDGQESGPQGKEDAI